MTNQFCDFFVSPYKKRERELHVEWCFDTMFSVYQHIFTRHRLTVLKLGIFHVVFFWEFSVELYKCLNFVRYRNWKIGLRTQPLLKHFQVNQHSPIYSGYLMPTWSIRFWNGSGFRRRHWNSSKWDWRCRTGTPYILLKTLLARPLKLGIDRVSHGSFVTISKKVTIS